MKTYLDHIHHLMKKFILARIIAPGDLCFPLQKDTEEIRLKWADDISWIVVSSIIETIHHPIASPKTKKTRNIKRSRNIDEVWDQAERSLLCFAIEDIKLHPNEGLRERFQRWADKFNRPMPRHPEFKRIPGTQHLKPPRLVVLVRYRFAEEFLLELDDQKKDAPEADALKAEIQRAFPDIAPEDRDYLIDEILRNWGRLNRATTRDQSAPLPMAIAARSFGVRNYGTFERHYLGGAVEESEIFEKALNQAREDTNS
jgi:hypothetical protein